MMAGRSFARAPSPAGRFDIVTTVLNGQVHEDILCAVDGGASRVTPVLRWVGLQCALSGSKLRGTADESSVG